MGLRDEKKLGFVHSRACTPDRGRGSIHSIYPTNAPYAQFPIRESFSSQGKGSELPTQIVVAPGRRL